MRCIRILFVCVLGLATAAPAVAQVQTGSIVGAVTDASGAILPGVTVSLAGDRLIGGVQTFVTDASGAYRFDRLPPGDYTVKFELQGFKPVTRAAVRVNAAFTATINAKLEVGDLAETITVTGESPTVDTKSNLQQTVMSQEILEGIPSGRDPWSLARLIPGVQVATYDVGGTQSIQQSSMSAHGSNTADASYNIDGATVNWPGGGGGATMMYYDQGMFEEVNYMTSAIPAEVMAGGVSINMVTKSASNAWRGKMLYSFANESLQGTNHEADHLPAGFLGNPTLETFDANFSGGGPIVRDRVWVNGTIRRWDVDKLTTSKNEDGSQALDDNTLKNYSIKGNVSLTANHKVMVSYLWNDKIRGHRRDGSDSISDIASVVQTNPVQTTQAKYTGVMRRTVFESSFSVMDGQTNYTYQPGTPADAIHRADFGLATQNLASRRHEEQPNSRHQFDNIVSYNASGFGGEHLIKGGVQYGRLYYEARYTVQGHHYVEYNNNVPNRIRLWNTPTDPKNLANIYGIFFQDSWQVGNRLTLNLGARWDKYTGILPEQSNVNVAFDLFDAGTLEADGTGPFIEPKDRPREEVLNHSKGVWRAGAVFDLTGDGRTALKANYSRYALQVGIDRVTAVNPLGSGSRTCPWSDPNGDGRFQANEITLSQCGGFSGGVNTRYVDKHIDWPYSDEVTAGIERQVGRDMRVGAMFYYRTNRDQIGSRNLAVPASVYTAHTINVPNGPGGTVQNPKPTTAVIYNLPASLAGAEDNIRVNDPYFDTEYKGVEFTASKRFTSRWQMVGGLTLGKNEGGIGGGDLNDPNTMTRPHGIVGNDSAWSVRLSGSYQLPYEIAFAGSLTANEGYPFVSSYSISRANAAAQGIALTRSTQAVQLSDRGDERYPNVALVDIRLSRQFRFGSRSFSPQMDIFNIGNAATVTSLNNAVGGTYLEPREIISPRIIRVGFTLNF
jgi:outer membrane receptor protein involved in Fe transport